MSTPIASDFEMPPSVKPNRPKSPPTVSAVPPSSKAELNVKDLTDSTDSTEIAADDAGGEPVYSKEELLRVFDEIIFSGEYRETFTIRGRVAVTFRTRTAEEISDIQRHIDSSGFALISTVENVRSIMNLQSALCNYRDKDLSMLKGKEKTSFVEKLPGPIVGMLLMLLSKFDNKISQACREGEENF